MKLQQAVFLHGRLIFLFWLCAATDCQLPRPILNAVYKLVDNHTKPGTIAQYTCSNGYVPQSKPKFGCPSALLVDVISRPAENI